MPCVFLCNISVRIEQWEGAIPPKVTATVCEHATIYLIGMILMTPYEYQS